MILKQSENALFPISSVSDEGIEAEGYESLGLTEDLLKWADLILATGTTLVNDTIDNFTGSVPIIFYGITVSGAAKLLHLHHFCPLGR